MGQAQGGTRLIDREASENAELRELSSRRVVIGQQVKGVAQGKDVERGAVYRQIAVGNLPARQVAAPLSGLFAAGVLDEDSAPRLRGSCKEVTARIPSLGAPGAIYELEISLMYQRRGLQSLPRFLAGQLSRRQLPQLVIDQRQEFFGRLRISRLDLRQDAGDIGHGPI